MRWTTIKCACCFMLVLYLLQIPVDAVYFAFQYFTLADNANLGCTCRCI